jgi:hypothetical protein
MVIIKLKHMVLSYLLIIFLDKLIEKIDVLCNRYLKTTNEQNTGSNLPTS